MYDNRDIVVVTNEAVASGQWPVASKTTVDIAPVGTITSP
jgi:hypothetical protein